jgi:hypothetical protein
MAIHTLGDDQTYICRKFAKPGFTFDDPDWNSEPETTLTLFLISLGVQFAHPCASEQSVEAVAFENAKTPASEILIPG